MVWREGYHDFSYCRHDERTLEHLATYCFNSRVLGGVHPNLALFPTVDH